MINNVWYNYAPNVSPGMHIQKLFIVYPVFYLTPPGSWVSQHLAMSADTALA